MENTEVPNSSNDDFNYYNRIIKIELVDDSNELNNSLGIGNLNNINLKWVIYMKVILNIK